MQKIKHLFAAQGRCNETNQPPCYLEQWSSVYTEGQNTNGMVAYPNKMPVADGKSAGRQPVKKSWMFKRNYTFSLATSNTGQADT